MSYWPVRISAANKEAFEDLQTQYVDIQLWQSSNADFICGNSLKTLFADAKLRCVVIDRQPGISLDTATTAAAAADDIEFIRVVISAADIIIEQITEMDRKMKYLNNLAAVYQRYAALIDGQSMIDFCEYLADRLLTYKKTNHALTAAIESRCTILQNECDALRSQNQAYKHELDRSADYLRAAEEEQNGCREQLHRVEARFDELRNCAKQMAKHIKYKRRKGPAASKNAAIADQSEQFSDDEYSDDDEPAAQKAERIAREASDAKATMQRIVMQQESRVVKKECAVNQRKKKKATGYILSQLSEHLDQDGLPLYMFMMVNELPEVPRGGGQQIGGDQLPDVDQPMDFFDWSLLVNERGIRVPAYYMHVFEQDPTRLTALRMAIEFSRPMRRDEFERLMSAVVLCGVARR